MNKYHAKKVKEDGYTFDSQREHARYCELKIMQKSKLIDTLTVHPKYPIEIEGKKICTVILDFSYWDEKHRIIRREDVKGHDTALSRLKRKMVEAYYDITVEVIR